MSPIADSRGGGRRKAHVHDVLTALGGSPDDLDRPSDGADRDASLGSRLDAYTRLARNRPAPLPPEPAPDAEPAVVVAEEPAPKVAPVAVAATAARRQPGPARRRPGLGLASAVRRAALRLVRAAGGFSRASMHAVRVGARFLARTAHELAAGLVGARAALKRPEPPPEPEHVAVGVSERVREWSSRDSAEDYADEEVAARETDVAAFETPPFERGSGGRWTPGLRWAILALLAGAVLAVVTHGGHGNRAAQTTQPPEPPPSRTAYADPRSYAAAMTRLALSSGRTELDGTPVCAEGGTYYRWTCRARGRPTLGAYAGRRLTFRCSPRSTPQPGGPPAVMIDCRPENPPLAA